jgi:cytochrome c oxidase assembly protein subunit 15
LVKRSFPLPFKVTVSIALCVALVVVVLGAFVRLSDAGLGCPDWPGCYGHVTGVPRTLAEIARANQAFPERPVVASKAVKEMVHRYFAGTLAVLILVLVVLAVRYRQRAHQPLKTPLALLLLVILQALLGMWTVTLLLKPIVVMAHLLGGFATLSLLWWLFLSGSNWANSNCGGGLAPYRLLALIGTAILVCQIALGGWTSANYAAAACPDFPTCQSQWWPRMDFSQGFTLSHGLGLNYEFGVLDNAARTAIHMTHRIGALMTAIYILALGSTLLLKAHDKVLRVVSAAVLGLTVLQVALGISNVLLGWPLSMAAAHNAIAALLLLSMLTLDYVLRPVGKAAVNETEREARENGAVSNALT